MSPPRASAGRWRRLGLRREVLILFPVVLLVLVVTSLFTLFSYRNGVADLIAERRSEASRLARAVVARIARQPLGDQAREALRQIEPVVNGVAVLDADGRVLLAVGELPNASIDLRSAEPRPGLRTGRWYQRLFAPDDRLRLDDPAAELLCGVAPFGPPESRRYVRIDLPADKLAAQVRALAILIPSVFLLDLALVVLALIFLRHLLAPYETLLDRARTLGAEQGDDEDELQFLLSTFERSIQALSRRESEEGEGDLETLERTLSASLQSGLLLLDRRGGVLALNPVGAQLLGVESSGAGQTLDQLLAREPELLGLLSGAVRDGTAPVRQECVLRAGEREITVGLTAHLLRRNDGEVRGFLVLFADLTAVRRQADERRLADSLAQLGEMAGGVAHELRNSLATLRGYLTLIERRPDEGQVADYLSEIRREADHLGRVLEDFLAFARPGSARSEVVILASLVEAAAADPQLRNLDHPVEVRISGLGLAAAKRVRVDPQLLERALRNLLHNAAHAEREAGRSGPIEIGIGVGEGGGELEITIDDRGPGIAPEVRERLFHPFVTGRRGGVGLGLALTQRIVLLHGGRVRLEDRPGGGVRAVLSLPADVLVTDGSGTASAGHSSDGLR